MILKIERYNKKDQKWVMYDNIRRLSISGYYKQSFGTEPDTCEHDVLIFDIDNKDGGVKSGVTYRVIRYALKDDSEISIAFDTIAYLLNDNGKTIEKIVANYND